MKKVLGIFIMFSMVLMFSASQVKAEVKNKQLLGEWVYEVSDAPYGYEKGSLIFAEKDGQTVLTIKLEAGEMPADSLKIEGNKISFSAQIQGSTINIELTHEKDQLTGKADSPEGPKTITAKKK
jgi:uncharacterized protein (TIGR03066 family)